MTKCLFALIRVTIICAPSKYYWPFLGDFWVLELAEIKFKSSRMASGLLARRSFDGRNIMSNCQIAQFQSSNNYCTDLFTATVSFISRWRRFGGEWLHRIGSLFVRCLHQFNGASYTVPNTS